MHIFLFGKVPSMPFIPDTYYKFAAIKKPRSPELGWRIRFVPDNELKCIEDRVKNLMPLAYQVIAGECKNSTCWFKYSLELVEPFSRIEDGCIPFGNIVVKILSPRHFDVASRVTT